MDRARRVKTIMYYSMHNRKIMADFLTVTPVNEGRRGRLGGWVYGPRTNPLYVMGIGGLSCTLDCYRFMNIYRPFFPPFRHSFPPSFGNLFFITSTIFIFLLFRLFNPSLSCSFIIHYFQVTFINSFLLSSLSSFSSFRHSTIFFIHSIFH